MPPVPPKIQELSFKDFYGLKSPDTVGLMYGQKKIISTAIQPALLARLKKTFALHGLKFKILNATHDYRARQNTFIISKKAEYLEMASEAYAKNRFDVIGMLLGYPACCVKAHFARVKSGGAGAANYIRRCAGARDEFFWPINNILDFDGRLVGPKAPRLDFASLRPISLISHNPCSYGCVASLRIAETNLLNIMRHKSALDRDSEYSLLAKPVLYLDDFNFAILEGTASGNSAAYSGTAQLVGLKTAGKSVAAGDSISVAGKQLSIFKKGRRIFKAELPAAPLILPFDRHA